MAWAGAQDHLANHVILGQKSGVGVADAQLTVCGTFNRGRGDKIINAIHGGPEMCPVCPGVIGHGARWPGV